MISPVDPSRRAFAARIAALALLSACSAHATLWVSSAGDDRNPGTEDEPVRSVERARDLVRALNKDMADDITVFIAGEHHLDAAVQFGPEDSATNGFSIIYTAAPGEHPALSGGIRVTGWTLSDPARNLWVAAAPSGLARAGDLFVNGTPVSQTRGRLVQFFPRDQPSEAAAPDPTAHWKNLSDVAFDPPAPGSLWSERGGTAPVFVRNAFELLGTPGEWYLDRQERRVYYTPRRAEDMALADVEACTGDSLVEVRGTAAHPVAGLIFKGLRFEYAARSGAPAAAVRVTGASGVQFLEDEFLHINAPGLDIGPAVAGAVVDGSLFADIAWSAVRVIGSSQVRISESRFSCDALRHFSEGVIDVDGSQDVTVDHDQVDRFPSVAILRTGGPSGTILEDSNLVGRPLINMHGTPASSAAAPAGDTGVPASYQSIVDQQVGAPTIPQPPGGVAAEAEDQFAYVTWMPACLEGGSPVTSYTVACSTGATMTISSEDFQAKGYVVMADLDNGHPVTFTVSAANAVGSSPPSLATAAVKPLRKRKLKAPPQPASVSVTTGPNGARLTIVPGASDGGSPVVSYSLDYQGNHDVLEGLDVIHADASHPVQRRIDGVSLSHSASVSVLATNAAGDGDPLVIKLR